MMGEIKLFATDHLQALREERRDEKILDGNTDTKIWRLVDNLKATYRCLILRTKHIDSWPTLRVTTVTGTLLAATRFCDFCTQITMLSPLT